LRKGHRVREHGQLDVAREELRHIAQFREFASDYAEALREP
jgi:hypothetical protein